MFTLLTVLSVLSAAPSTSTSSARLYSAAERAEIQALDTRVTEIQDSHAGGRTLLRVGIATAAVPLVGGLGTVLVGTMVGGLVALFGGGFGYAFMTIVGAIPGVVWIVGAVVLVAGAVMTGFGIASKMAERKETTPLMRERRAIIDSPVARVETVSAPPLLTF